MPYPVSLLLFYSVIFQSVIFQSCKFQSCKFHPCDFVRHFPVLQNPLPVFWWSIIFQSCKFQSPSKTTNHAIIIRLHHMHCIRRGLLLQMLHVAWSVCLSVCWSYRCALQKHGWTDWYAIRRLTHMGPRNHAGQDRTNAFTATRGDKSVMWPFA